MKPTGVSRRRFLALCGGGIAGTWLAGAGFVELSSEMVFAMSGSCSFCGKEAKEIFGLAGITHRNSRICNECIELCFDILAEEGNAEFAAAIAAAGEHGDPVVAAAELLAQTMEKILKKPSMPTSHVENLICSFCDKHHDNVAKLNPVLTVYICDGCVGEAGALFMRYGWRYGWRPEA